MQGCVLWGFEQPATQQLSAILSRIAESEDSQLTCLHISGISWAAVSPELVARAALRLERLRQWFSAETENRFSRLKNVSAFRNLISRDYINRKVKKRGCIKSIGFNFFDESLL